MYCNANQFQNTVLESFLNGWKYYLILKCHTDLKCSTKFNGSFAEVGKIGIHFSSSCRCGLISIYCVHACMLVPLPVPFYLNLYN